MNVPRYGQPNMSSPNIVAQWGPITDATQGMSGGAWVYNLDPAERANSNILIAVTSFSPFNGYKAAVLSRRNVCSLPDGGGIQSAVHLREQTAANDGLSQVVKIQRGRRRFVRTEQKEHRPCLLRPF